jgi:hypothetical protein
LNNYEKYCEEMNTSRGETDNEPPPSVKKVKQHVKGRKAKQSSHIAGLFLDSLQLLSTSRIISETNGDELILL